MRKGSEAWGGAAGEIDGKRRRRPGDWRSRLALRKERMRVRVSRMGASEKSNRVGPNGIGCNSFFSSHRP